MKFYFKRHSKRHSEKSGLPPGSLIHIGERKIDKADVSLTVFDEAQLVEKETEDIQEIVGALDFKRVNWIQVEGLHDPEIIKKLGKAFKLNEMVQEDILNTEQRPKLEEYPDWLFIVLKAFYTTAGEEGIEVEQISVIAGEHYVITFQESGRDIFAAVKKRIQDNTRRIRKSGADYLAYTLLDTIVDQYFPVTERIEEKLISVEESLMDELTQYTLNQIYQLKREILFLRKLILPLRDLIYGLKKTDNPFYSEGMQIYFQDLYDHTVQLLETVETHRELVNGLLDLYHTSVSNKMNEIMKTLTIIATLFIPLTFVAGVYGMNFKFMPELDWIYGYPVIIAVMLVMAVFMLGYLRIKKWL